MANTVVKVIVVGESAVGKTSMIHQFVNRTFTADFKSTIGSDFTSKPVAVDDSIVNLQIWDTAGQERYRSLSTSYFKGCEAAVIVFDITSADSFDRVTSWFDEVKRSCNLSAQDLAGRTPFPVFIVGNKSDLDGMRQVAKAEASKYCKSHGWQYMEFSAKYGDNIDNIFKACAVAVVDRRNQAPDPVRPTSVGRGGPASMQRRQQSPGAKENGAASATASTKTCGCSR